MNHEDDLRGSGIQIRDDLLDQRPYQTLLRGAVGRGRIPGRLEVVGQSKEGLAIQRSRRSCGRFPQALLARLQPHEGMIPALLQLGCDQPVVWIHRVVAPPRELDLVLGLLPLELERSLTFAAVLLLQIHGSEGRLDRQGLHDGEQLRSDSIVGPGRTERDTARLSMHLGSQPARVARVAPTPSSVLHAEHPPTASAAQQSGEQRSTSASGLGRACRLSIRIASDPLLVALEGRPIDVARVVIAEQDRPLRRRAAMTVALAGPPLDERGPVARLPVGIGACIERILQQADDVAIGRQAPAQGIEPLSVGGTGKEQSLSTHVLVNLAAAVEPIEQAEDGVHSLLDATIGVDLEAGFAGPEVANGNRKSELSALHLLERSFDQSASHQCQLELTHGALEAEKQSIVGNGGIVGSLAIEDACTDEGTELEKLVPVATIASEPRRLEAEDGADHSLADLREQRVEPGSSDEPTRRAPKIVVDRHYVAEAVLAGEPDELVLTSLAF